MNQETTDSAAATLAELLSLIEVLRETEDSAGCDESLTVVGRPETQALFEAASRVRADMQDLPQVTYLQSGGTRCPSCGSHDITGESVEVNEGTATQEVSCLACEAEWVDMYRLVGFQEA